MVTIEVTQRHINDGQALSCSECPGALGLRDAFSGLAANVCSDYVMLYARGEEWEYQSPDALAAFVEAYDNGDKVFPFTFTLPDHDLNGKPTPEART